MAIINKIFIGSLTEPSYYFENDNIVLPSINVNQSVSLVGQELSIDTFSATVIDDYENTVNAYLFRSSDGYVIETADQSIYAIDVTNATGASSLINIPEWTPVWYYQNNDLVGKFYIESVKRVARYQYQLNCISAIGRIDKMRHGGGLFQTTTFGAVLQHILAAGLHGDGDPAIEYSIDDDIAELPVSGWLPYDTKRNNLYQLIFANGVNIIKNADGNPRFTFVYTSGGTPEHIEDEQIFMAGNVEYQKPYSMVTVMEHTYSAITSGVEPSVLYDNTDGERVSNAEIWFDQAPVIVSTLVASEGLTIVSATENSAVITGNGTISGIPYTHTTRTVSKVNETGDEEKTASVEQCTMVNAINSQNLLNRLYAFYCPDDHIKKITNELVYDDERCGKQYQFLNPYSETENALLSKMSLNATTFNRASCEFYGDYVPAGQAGLYQHCVVLDKETYMQDGGVFVVPQEVFQSESPSIRVVMIGGGTGGGSGWPGENGNDAYTYTNVALDDDITARWYGAEGGDGGNGGEGGTPGRVYSIVIENPSASYNYTIGEGGEGGAATGFIPDTVDELRDALENENPDGSWTDEEIEAMIAQEQTDWNGSPNAGTAGTASTFGSYSTEDTGSYVPRGGVYNPITGDFYALKGYTGIKGGKGGARKVGSQGLFTFTTDGEDVTGDDGTVYRGGRTGQPFTSISGLPEAILTAYGGNGAGAAVGLDRADHTHMDGGSDQSATWEVTTD